MNMIMIFNNKNLLCKFSKCFFLKTQRVFNVNSKITLMREIKWWWMSVSIMHMNVMNGQKKN